VNDLPIQKDYSHFKNEIINKTGEKPIGFKKFKKSWIKT